MNDKNQLTDIQIAHNAEMRPIVEIAGKLGLSEDDIELYGKYKAKVNLNVLEKYTKKIPGKLILVSAITPTPAGEGKTTISIGLAQGLAKLGYNAALALREPSLGPCMGIKGGATGGGYSLVLPMEDINLHFTGDMHAVTAANNLLAAMLDNEIFRSDELQIDPRRITWKRVIDMNDRSLRDMIIGLGGTLQGVPRETGFDITAASEIMAILCLSESLQGLKDRLSRILVATTYDGKPVTADQLNAAGAMTVLLKDALKPNLVQTIEKVPAFIHGGPFANIAQGTNSILATKMAMTLADYAVTEAGFGFDLGAEKFYDIKSLYGRLDTAATVLVATVRALKYHGGERLRHLEKPNPEAVKKGLPNLEKHLESIKLFREPPVVAVNRFNHDTDEEIEVVVNRCRDLGVSCAVAEVFQRGGDGGTELAKAVIAAAEPVSKPFEPIYDWNWSVEDKIAAVATKVYGADNVIYEKDARRNLKIIKKLKYDKLPVCIAKTQKSLSDDPRLKGAPSEFDLNVREIQIAAGAGFLIPIVGEIMRMPGLPANPAASDIDIDDNGEITGLK